MLPCTGNYPEQAEVSSLLVKTTIPIVYKNKDKFYVLDGLDTLKKSEVWGMKLKHGIFIKKTEGGAGRWQDAETMSWHDCKTFAETMTFNKKQGTLPSKELMKAHKGEEKEAFNETVEILNKHGVEASTYAGICWCIEEKEDNPYYAYRFSLNIWEYVADKYNTEQDSRRIILYFPE